MNNLDAKLRAAVRYANPLFCDTGRNAGMYAIDLHGRIYLTSEELAELQGAATEREKGSYAQE